ncbi:MAG: hypothetical protein J2P41_09830 [Blastocatellia bacterium]|nr:hypothetical protein [Blastocatellia bacterium]
MARKTHIYALLLCLSGVAYTAQAQKPYRLPDSKVGSTIHKLADSAQEYHNALYKGVKKSEFFRNGGREERILADANEFENLTFRLKERFDKDRSGDERALSDDVRSVLRKATTVNRFMVINFGRTGADDKWAVVKQNLELLAQSYNVVWVGYGISNRPRRMDDADAKELLAEIRDRSELFRKGMESFVKVERSIDPYTRKDINDEVKNFIGLVSHLKGRVDDKDGGTPVFNDLMRSEAKINKFISDMRYRLQPQIKEDWRTIHNDLVDLARGYKVYPGNYEYY